MDTRAVWNKVAVRMLKGHTTLRANMFKLVLTQFQDCRMCEDEKEDSGHTVCH
jgi:hypothetical protein